MNTKRSYVHMSAPLPVSLSATWTTPAMAGSSRPSATGIRITATR